MIMKNMTMKTMILSVGFLALTSLLSYGIWHKVKNMEMLVQAVQDNVEQDRSHMTKKWSSLREEVAQLPLEIESGAAHGAGHRMLWANLQRKVKNTVVQVEAQIAEYNWIEPYKTPNQKQSFGTAFFINKDGELVTNAHVVAQAIAVYIRLPILGKRQFMVDVVGLSPARDLALLRLSEKDRETMLKELQIDELPYLDFSDSDLVNRGEEIMTLGYPLGQTGLKSTTGVVSGSEHVESQYYFQIDAPINPGNSGGPSVNTAGQVIGVNAANIPSAQNVGYIIPSNEVALFLDQLRSFGPQKKPKLLEKPYIGIFYNTVTDHVTRYLGNPVPGGLYVAANYKGSLLDRAGIKPGDMIYRINGFRIDVHGDIAGVPWAEERISILDYISRLAIGKNVVLEYYRNGAKKQATFVFDYSELPPIRPMYPGYEPLDYEVLGGLVLMQLSTNHIIILAKINPDLLQYTDLDKPMDPAIVISWVQINSPAEAAHAFTPGMLIDKINNVEVKTLDDFRRVVKEHAHTGYLTIKTKKGKFAALSIQEVLDNERRLASTYFYPLSKTFKELEQTLGKKNTHTRNHKKNRSA